MSTPLCACHNMHIHFRLHRLKSDLFAPPRQLAIHQPLFFFFLNDRPPPEIYTLPLHAALPIYSGVRSAWGSSVGIVSAPMSSRVTSALRALFTLPAGAGPRCSSRRTSV